MRILVTGGVGFISPHLVGCLLAGKHDEVVDSDVLRYSENLDN